MSLPKQCTINETEHFGIVLGFFVSLGVGFGRFYLSVNFDIEFEHDELRKTSCLSTIH